MEGALITKHNIGKRNGAETTENTKRKALYNSSLKGRSSLRLAKEESRQFPNRRKNSKGPHTTGRTWASIEAIASLDEEDAQVIQRY